MGEVVEIHHHCMLPAGGQNHIPPSRTLCMWDPGDHILMTQQVQGQVQSQSLSSVGLLLSCLGPKKGFGLEQKIKRIC